MIVKMIDYEEAKEFLERASLNINTPTEIQISNYGLFYKKLWLWRKDGKLFLWKDFRGFFMIEKEGLK
ncbi:MAG: hypothetical protein AAB772_01435 [Patescibacteria group bacterium]